MLGPDVHFLGAKHFGDEKPDKRKQRKFSAKQDKAK